MEEDKKEKSIIEKIEIAYIQIKVDGEKLNLKKFKDWYVWLEEKIKDSVFNTNNNRKID